MLIWNFFKNYLLSHRAGALIRKLAWLCIVGIAVGVASLIIVISVMNGFNDSIRNRLLAVEPHIVLTQEKEQAQADVDVLLAELKERESVKEVYPYESQDVIIRTVDGTFGGGVARGLHEEGFSQFMTRVAGSQLKREEREKCEEKRALEEAQKAAGEPMAAEMATYVDVRCPYEMSPESLRLEEGEVIMGAGLARSLGIIEGDQVTMIPPESLLLPPGEAPPFEKVTVKSLLNTSLEDIDGKMVFYGLGKSFTHFSEAASRQVGVEIRIEDPSNAAGSLSQWKPEGWAGQTWMDRNSSLFFALRMEKIAMGTFLGLSALITSFSIITVLIMLMAQKRQDIGMLMAMGMSPAHTRRIFMQVGMVLAMCGAGSGLVIGLAVSLYLHFFPPEVLPNIYYDSSIPATVHWPLVGLVFLAAGLISYFGSLLPVRVNVRMTPSEALRR